MPRTWRLWVGGERCRSDFSLAGFERANKDASVSRSRCRLRDARSLAKTSFVKEGWPATAGIMTARVGRSENFMVIGNLDKI